jgi:hypothetical protein
MLAYFAVAHAGFADLLRQKGSYLQGRRRRGGVVENREDILTQFGNKFVNASEQNRAGKRARPRGFALPASRPRIVHRRCSRPRKDDQAPMVLVKPWLKTGGSQATWLTANSSRARSIG